MVVLSEDLEDVSVRVDSRPVNIIANCVSCAVDLNLSRVDEVSQEL